MVSVPQSVADPAQCVAVNCTGTQHVLDAAREGGVKRIVFASSAAVYGDEPSLPSEEDDVLDPRSPYAATKAAGENLLHAYSACFDISTVSLRYFNVFGPGQSSKSAYAAAIAAFGDALTSGKQPTIHGDGKQTRDFVYIDNVVHANLLAASSERDLRGEAINIGTGQRIDLLRVLKAMGDALHVPVSPSFGPKRAGDVRDSCANIRRAKAMLGYEPVVGFEEGIGKLFAPRAKPHTLPLGTESGART
jgi:UDP-glucose 4-epimerase